LTAALSPPSLSGAVNLTVLTDSSANVWVTIVPEGPVTVWSTVPSPFQSMLKVNPAAVSTVDGSVAPSVNDSGWLRTPIAGPLMVAVGATLTIGKVTVSV